MYRIQVLRDGTRMIFDTPMLTFDETALRHLAQRMLGSQRNQPAMMAAMMDDRYKAMLAELTAAGGAVEHVRGLTYDLAESFDRVNRDYFNGQMPRPALAWSQALTGRKFGPLRLRRDPRLRQPHPRFTEVPAFVVGPRHAPRTAAQEARPALPYQRQHAHTPEFPREERSFRQYAEAERISEERSAMDGGPEIAGKRGSGHGHMRMPRTPPRWPLLNPQLSTLNSPSASYSFLAAAM
jgi:hypothetical protein